MTKLPILYSFRRCPYAMRARLALAFAGQGYLLREVDLKHKPQAMLEVSSKGTVPVLVLPEQAAQNKVIDESLEIVAWALAAKPQSITTHNKEAAQALVTALHDHFIPNLNKYKYPDLYHLKDGTPFWLACADYLAQLEPLLARQQFLEADQVGYADFAIFPLIRQCWVVNPQWFEQAPYPFVNRWLRWFMDHPLFEQIMLKHEPWSPEQGEGVEVAFKQDR